MRKPKKVVIRGRSPESQRAVREALVSALERCWEGKLPFREVEKALEALSA